MIRGKKLANDELHEKALDSVIFRGGIKRWAVSSKTE